MNDRRRAFELALAKVDARSREERPSHIGLALTAMALLVLAMCLVA